MAWIESHQEVGRHPKTRKLARMLHISLPAAVGHLHYLWWWALDFAQEGALARYDATEIADAALWEEDASAFLEALIAVGFIDEDDECGTLRLHDWEEYAGKLLNQREAQRQANADRQARWRERHAPVTEKHNEAVTPHNGNITVTNTLRNAPVTPSNAPTVPNRTVPNITSTEITASSAAEESNEQTEAMDATAPLHSPSQHAHVENTQETAQPAPATDRHKPKPLAPKNVTPITPRKNDAIWDALVDLMEYAPATKGERSNWGKAVKDLEEAGATPDEMRKRAGRYVAKYGRERLTVNAFVNHWSEMSIEARASPQSAPAKVANGAYRPPEPPRHLDTVADHDPWKTKTPVAQSQ